VSSRVRSGQKTLKRTEKKRQAVQIKLNGDTSGVKIPVRVKNQPLTSTLIKTGCGGKARERWAKRRPPPIRLATGGIPPFPKRIIKKGKKNAEPNPSQERRPPVRPIGALVEIGQTEPWRTGIPTKAWDAHEYSALLVAPAALVNGQKTAYGVRKKIYGHIERRPCTRACTHGLTRCES